MDDKAFMTNREILREVHSDVKRMKNAMFGDKDAEIPGLVHRVDKLEKSDNKRGKIYIIISTISTGIGIAFSQMKDWFK